MAIRHTCESDMDIPLNFINEYGLRINFIIYIAPMNGRICQDHLHELGIVLKVQNNLMKVDYF